MNVLRTNFLFSRYSQNVRQDDGHVVNKECSEQIGEYEYYLMDLDQSDNSCSREEKAKPNQQFKSGSQGN